MPGISSSIDGELLIDEDYLRSRGFIEFDKYALVKDRNVPRMMPAKFPNLKVAEHDQIGFSVNKSSRL